jgi:hypothetical protein
VAADLRVAAPGQLARRASRSRRAELAADRERRPTAHVGLPRCAGAFCPCGARVLPAVDRRGVAARKHRDLLADRIAVAVVAVEQAAALQMSQDACSDAREASDFRSSAERDLGPEARSPKSGADLQGRLQAETANASAACSSKYGAADAQACGLHAPGSRTTPSNLKSEVRSLPLMAAGDSRMRCGSIRAAL